ncbi:MAG: putative lipid II flippase FtsW [Patescibacteria group bacterium]|nr:putative lipid II flippase FtsW [Patescibacteria group bacterium]
MANVKKKVLSIFQERKGMHAPDFLLLITIFLLLIFGLIFLSSASSVFSYVKFGDAYHFFKNQVINLILGIVVFWFFIQIDYREWRKYAFGFLIFSVFLLILVFIPGLSAAWGKSRSWIDIFGFSLQPSEFVKLSFLLYLSAWLEARKEELSEVEAGIGPFVAVLGVIALFMIMQPDVGTLSIVTITALIVYYIGGGKIKHIIAIVLIGIVAFGFMVQVRPYQLNRFKCMMDPQFDPQGVCYQVNQSLIAVGSGGIFGRGIGDSRQKFMYLPEVSGDSIYAIIAEESGLIMSVILVLLFIFLFFRGYMIAKKAPDDFGRILAIGIVSWISVQAIINIGGVINLMPMTGVPLPFISYGGSAILSVMAASGILVNISRQTKE